MDVSLILNAVTTLAVVLGVIFGLLEFRQALHDRRDQAAVDIVRTIQTQEIRRAGARVMTLPDDVEPSVVR